MQQNAYFKHTTYIVNTYIRAHIPYIHTHTFVHAYTHTYKPIYILIGTILTKLLLLLHTSYIHQLWRDIQAPAFVPIARRAPARCASIYVGVSFFFQLD